MTFELIGILIIAAFLLIGAIFTLVGAIGLLKFNDPMTRLHAPTKAATVGLGAFLIASMSYAYTFGEGSLHELLITGFLIVTAPVSANFIAKVNLHCKSCVMPPAPSQDDTWSTFATPDVNDTDGDPKNG